MRHGQTAWNLDQRAQGHRDLPLDETGQLQAKSVHLAFEGESVKQVITSDLERAVETAKPIAERFHLEPILDKRVRERNFGEWEGAGFAEIGALFEVHGAVQGIKDKAIVRPPKGESMQDVWNRLVPVHQELNESDHNVVIVSHGGTCSVLLAMLIGGTLQTSSSFKFYNTGITTLERLRDGRFRLLKYNDISHLGGVEAISGAVDGSSR